jgi:hypothetical protein
MSCLSETGIQIKFCVIVFRLAEKLFFRLSRPAYTQKLRPGAFAVSVIGVIRGRYLETGADFRFK